MFSKLDYAAWIYSKFALPPEEFEASGFNKDNAVKVVTDKFDTDEWTEEKADKAVTYIRSIEFIEPIVYFTSSEHAENLTKFKEAVTNYMYSTRKLHHEWFVAYEIAQALNLLNDIIKDRNIHNEITNSADPRWYMKLFNMDFIKEMTSNIDAHISKLNYAVWIFYWHDSSQIDEAIGAFENAERYMKEHGIDAPARYFSDPEWPQKVDRFVRAVRGYHDWENCTDEMANAYKIAKGLDILGLILNSNNKIDDSGKRISYGEGKSIREPSDGKGRFDLISPFALSRLAKWYELGAQKYSDRNWEKGGIPFSRYLDSALRHLNKFAMGMTDEDHLSAAAWNIFAIMHFQELNETEFDDMPRYDGKGV